MLQGEEGLGWAYWRICIHAGQGEGWVGKPQRECIHVQIVYTEYITKLQDESLGWEILDCIDTVQDVEKPRQ